jgi:formylglycine-generating enzyme required for sulfatase activity
MTEQRFLKTCMELCLVCLVVSCSVGRQPPSPTPTVFIDGSEEFLMGSEDFDPCGRFKFQNDRLSLVADDEIASERLRYEANVAPFCADRHEVTILQYEHCVLRGTCEPPKVTNLGRLDRGDAIGRYWSQRAQYLNYPVVGVEWQDAKTYCEFRGGRLPTEVEWEYLSKGGQSDAHSMLSSEAIEGVEGDCGSAFEQLALGNCSASILPVSSGLFDDNGLGVLGLYGSVSEWTADEYDDYAGCAQAQGTIDGQDIGLDRLLCQSSDRIYRRPLSTLLSSNDTACITTSEAAESLSCEADLSFGGMCLEGFQACYTECGHEHGENLMPGQVCLADCFSDYEVCVEPCIHPDTQVTCVRLTDGQNCFPEPFCRRRAPRDSRRPHVIPTFLRESKVAHVVKGADFQTDRVCDVRASRRTSSRMAQSTIGFRCVFEPEGSECANSGAQESD